LNIIQLQAWLAHIVTLFTHDLREFCGPRRNTWLHFGEQFLKYRQLHAKVVS